MTTNILERLRHENVARFEELKETKLDPANAYEHAIDIAEKLVKAADYSMVLVDNTEAPTDGLEASLANAIINADLLAAMYGIDLCKVIAEKFNRQSEVLGSKRRLAI